MVTFLGILKIIGIVLACIIGFVLFLVLLVLFVPVRYCLSGQKITGKEAEEPAPLYGKVIVSWLLHIFQGEVIYDQGVNIIIRIFGIPLFNQKKRSEKPKKEKKEKKSDKKTSLSETSPAVSPDESVMDQELLDIVQDEMKTEDSVHEAQKDVNAQSSSEETEEKGKKKKIPLKERFSSVKKAFEDLPGNFEELRGKIVDKISSIVETVRYYYRLLHTKGATYVFDFLKKEVKKIFKHLRPRSVKGFIDYSSDDPAASANVCKYYGYAISLVPKNLMVNIGYGEKNVSFKAKIKGHIILGYMGLQGLKVLFNKRVRILIRKLKREGE